MTQGVKSEEVTQGVRSVSIHFVWVRYDSSISILLAFEFPYFILSLALVLNCLHFVLPTSPSLHCPLEFYSQQMGENKSNGKTNHSLRYSLQILLHLQNLK